MSVCESGRVGELEVKDVRFCELLCKDQSLKIDISGLCSTQTLVRFRPVISSIVTAKPRVIGCSTSNLQDQV